MPQGPSWARSGRGGAATSERLAPASAPAPERDHQTLEQLRLPGPVREHRRLPLGAEARDEDRLLGAVLAYPLGAVTDADARFTGASEGRFVREVVDERIVHAGIARVEAARHRLPL